MTDLYEETDEIRCPMCNQQACDPGETHDGAGFDGKHMVRCGGGQHGVPIGPGCGCHFEVERLVIVRYRLMPLAPGDSLEVGEVDSTDEIDCDWDDCPPTESSPQTARSMYS
jgi:hypothetical protein